MQYIFRSNGQYLGFIQNGYLFSRDGIYLGWVEDNHVWDANGQYRGFIKDSRYILRNLYIVPPVSRAPKALPAIPALPVPTANIVAINLPIGYVDAF